MTPATEYYLELHDKVIVMQRPNADKLPKILRTGANINVSKPAMKVIQKVDLKKIKGSISVVEEEISPE